MQKKYSWGDQERKLNIMRLGIVLIFVSVFGLLAGCSSANDSSRSGNQSSSTYDQSAEDTSLYSLTDNGRLEVSFNKQIANTDNDDETVTSNEEFERKIIREQYIEQQVEDLQATLASIEALVNKTQGGYIEALDEWRTEQRQTVEHRASLIVRIPTQLFPSFLADIERHGVISRRQVKGEDVTDEFIDNESRLRNLGTHEERLLQLFEQAKTIDEMLKLENELSRIREQVEVLEGRQNYLHHATSTVKLGIELFQVEEEVMNASTDPSVLSASKAGFMQSLKQLKWLIERVIILLVTIFPYLLILIAIGSVWLWLARKRSSQSAESKKKPTPPAE